MDRLIFLYNLAVHSWNCGIHKERIDPECHRVPDRDGSFVLIEQSYEQEEKTITASDGIAFDRELSAGDAKLCGRDVHSED